MGDTPNALMPGSKAYLQEKAKDFGIKGWSRLTKPDLAEAVSSATIAHGSKRTVGPRSGASPDFPAASGRPLQMISDAEPAHSLPPGQQIPDPDATAATTRPAGASNTPEQGMVAPSDVSAIPAPQEPIPMDAAPQPSEFDGHLSDLKQILAAIDAQQAQTPFSPQANAAPQPAQPMLQPQPQPQFPQNALMQASR